MLLAGVMVGSAAVLTASGAMTDTLEPLNSDDLATALDDRADEVDEAALSRSLDRSAPTPTPSASPATGMSSTSQAAPALPAPVAGLNQQQMNNAQTIVEVGQSMGMERRALIIAVATAMQESRLQNVASYAVPASLKYPHEGTGSDHDSIGVFQQRPSMGWGTVANLMKPEYQTKNFFTRLNKVAWQNMSLTQAAQAVQRSGYPGAYAKHESKATTIVDALL